MKIGIVGASGYSGGELLRNLLTHPEFEVSYIAAGSSAGEAITDIHPHLTEYSGRLFEATDVATMNTCDLIFFALPHGESAKYAAELNPQVKVVDLGADFRLHDAGAWSQYYGGSHAGTWQYGLPELPGERAKIASSTRIANPGCYATSIIIGSAPAVANSIIASDDIVIVAASGVTGAGRSAKVSLLGAETMNSLTSYKFGGVHQHTPEIEQALNGVSAGNTKISFTPILAPMPRGILSTITAKLITPISEDDVRKLFEEFYKDEQYIALLPKGAMPRTSSVTGSNSIHLQVAVDAHTSRLVISVAIDNLGKGAATAAIQNANIICGLPESYGISATGVRS